MNIITQGVTEHRLPNYMEEILTHNYCPYFVRMSMVRDKDNYSFSYRPGSLERINVAELDTYKKLVLIRSLITLDRRAEDYLIRAENYLLEPELIFTTDNKVTVNDIKILFYPDIKRMRFDRKIRLFTGRIVNTEIRSERELMNQLIGLFENSDVNRAALFLDKSILRMEARSAKDK